MANDVIKLRIRLFRRGSPPAIPASQRAGVTVQAEQNEYRSSQGRRSAISRVTSRRPLTRTWAPDPTPSAQ